MKSREFIRLLHTVRHLKPIQITNRLQRRLMGPTWRSVPAPPRRPRTGHWASPCARPISLVGPQRMEVFRQEIEVRSREDWQRSELPHLVQYNLHYFDDLNAVDARQRTHWHEALIRQWIEQNPPGEGPGWEPYPLSMRIVNWVKWCIRGNAVHPQMLDSLATQAQALSEQLEYHLLGNHLLANAKALVFAGTFFQGPDADRWRQIGHRILEQQASEQILPDGGHFELSPMYHSIILEDFLDVLNLAAGYSDAAGLGSVQRLREIVGPMRRWLLVMTHPDGQISMFNDAAFGIAIAPAGLEAYAQRLDLPPTERTAAPIVHLAASGYVRLERGGSVLLVDVARVGPDYQPGHAHADTLSCEWSLGEQRVIVNSGTSQYGVGPERQRQRGTAAHSTVEVDGQDSSEVWSGFRVGRRAVPSQIELTERADFLEVVGSHDGYRRLPGRVVHQRRWRLAVDQLQICDALSGGFRTAVARFYLHPDVRSASQPGMDGWRWLIPGHTMQPRIEGGEVRCVSSTFHPQFGVSEPNLCVESRLRQTAHELLVRWSAP